MPEPTAGHQAEKKPSRLDWLEAESKHDDLAEAARIARARLAESYVTSWSGVVDPRTIRRLSTLQVAEALEHARTVLAMARASRAQNLFVWSVLGSPLRYNSYRRDYHDARAVVRALRDEAERRYESVKAEAKALRKALKEVRWER